PRPVGVREVDELVPVVWGQLFLSLLNRSGGRDGAITREDPLPQEVGGIGIRVVLEVAVGEPRDDTLLERRHELLDLQNLHLALPLAARPPDNASARATRFPLRRRSDRGRRRSRAPAASTPYRRAWSRCQTVGLPWRAGPPRYSAGGPLAWRSGRAALPRQRRRASRPGTPAWH